ncbi:MAG TPA: DUF4384 domain-containing protein [Polyangia bacterium]|nr:DUF4384 domain-containing protein [Polyangia bacterium]
MSTPVRSTATSRRRPESCLSDLALERFLVGELDALEPAAAIGAATERHLAECAACRARRDELAAAPAQVPDEIWWRRQQAARPALAPAPARARVLTRTVVGGLIAVAAVLVLMARPRPADRSASGGDTRTKGGGFAMEIVARRTDGSTVPVFDGTALRPGDAIRFVLTTADAGNVAVVGMDSAGQVSVYAPAAMDAALGVAAGTHQLPGSVVLDDTPGDERFVALLCLAAPTRAALMAAGQQALAAAGGQPTRTTRLDLPCRQSGVTIRKEVAR